MRSIEARFKEHYKNSTTSYLAFVRAIKEQGFSRDSIARSFVKLVDKSDYDKKEKNQIIDYLVHLSSPLRSTE